MKQFNDFDKAKKDATFNGGGQIPLGTYVCKILKVKYEDNSSKGYGDQLKIAFDVEEGEQKGFFKNQFDSNSDENKKWKGTVNLWIPTDDGSEQDYWTKTTFAKWPNAIEESNPGYAWDWDENKWTGKLVGIIFREHGAVTKDGKHIKYVEAGTPVPIDYARKNPDKVGKIKKDKNFNEALVGKDSVKNNTDFMAIPDTEEEELPF